MDEYLFKLDILTSTSWFYTDSYLEMYKRQSVWSTIKVHWAWAFIIHCYWSISSVLAFDKEKYILSYERTSFNSSQTPKWSFTLGK